MAVQNPNQILSENLQPNQELPETLLTRIPKNARDAREILSVRSAFDQKLVDIFKQGR